MSLDATLYVVEPMDGNVYHVRRHGRGNSLCGQWSGDRYIVQRPLLRPGVEPPNCIACVARLP